MMGSLRCKKPFSSSMYHNSNNNNNKKISNKKFSNRNNDKKNYNCFTIESSRPNFPQKTLFCCSPAVAVAVASSSSYPLTAIYNHRPSNRFYASSSSSSSCSLSFNKPVPMSLAKRDWRRSSPAQDSLHTGLHQKSR